MTVHKTALGDTAGRVLMDAAEGGEAGGNAAVGVGDLSSGISVPITTLDSLPWPARVSAIKIDVEGYELRVLRGGAELIARDRPVIYGEFSKVWLDLRGDDLAPFLMDLFDAGYDIFTVQEARSRPWRAQDGTRIAPSRAARLPRISYSCRDRQSGKWSDGLLHLHSLSNRRAPKRRRWHVRAPRDPT